MAPARHSGLPRTNNAGRTPAPPQLRQAMLHSSVLVKQVPDTANITGKVMNDDGTVNRAKLPAVFNTEDRVALEMALRVRDQYGGSVTALTMGPQRATDVLRECLFMGADAACLVTDRKF